MPRVAVLPDALANQIAAGEVVERPASVVKELVENALDAEATRVVVTLAGAGQRLIRVVDDGLGMDREDAVLALRRHATSKISADDDLLGIDTLGFRGEALPSIASVSRFRLVTRPRDAPVGTEVTVEGGDEPVIRDAGTPPGTRIEVADLFYNVPARLKFLKQPATENSHVAALMTSFALGHPHVHFRFEKDGRVAADHPVARRLEQRVFQVLGRQMADRLHAVELDGPIRVRGYISEPTFTRTTQQHIHTFVNGRRVRDRTVTHAFISAYGGMLQRGHFPQGVLYVHLDPRAIDVNVHPAKAEIRFVDGGAVHTAIARACRATLAAAPWRRAAGSTSGLPAAARAAAPATYRAGRAPSLFDLGEPSHRDLPPPRRQELRYDLPVSPWAAVPEVPSPSSPPPRGGPPAGDDALVEPAGPGDRAAFLGNLRVVGVVAKRFVVCEAAGAVHFIDGRAAGRLVREGELLAALASADAAATGRPLIFPAQLELSPLDHPVLSAHAASLARFGFDLEPFGGRTWQVLALPGAVGDADPAALVAAALDALRDLGSSTGERAERALAEAFSRAADRADAPVPDAAAATSLIAALGARVTASDVDVDAVIVSFPLEALAR